MFGFREDILAGGGDGELLDPGLEEEKVFTDNLEYSCLYRYTGGRCLQTTWSTPVSWGRGVRGGYWVPPGGGARIWCGETMKNKMLKGNLIQPFLIFLNKKLSSKTLKIVIAQTKITSAKKIFLVIKNVKKIWTSKGQFSSFLILFTQNFSN